MSKKIKTRGIKARPAILAAATGVIAVIGAWCGAGLKEKQKTNQRVEARRQATPADKIAILQLSRSALMAKKAAVETKIAEVEGRKYTLDGKKVIQPGQGRQF